MLQAWHVPAAFLSSLPGPLSSLALYPQALVAVAIPASAAAFQPCPSTDPLAHDAQQDTPLDSLPSSLASEPARAETHGASTACDHAASLQAAAQQPWACSDPAAQQVCVPSDSSQLGTTTRAQPAPRLLHRCLLGRALQKAQAATAWLLAGHSGSGNAVEGRHATAEGPGPELKMPQPHTRACFAAPLRLEGCMPGGATEGRDDEHQVRRQPPQESLDCTDVSTIALHAWLDLLSDMP